MKTKEVIKKVDILAKHVSDSEDIIMNHPIVRALEDMGMHATVNMSLFATPSLLYIDEGEYIFVYKFRYTRYDHDHVRLKAMLAKPNTLVDSIQVHFLRKKKMLGVFK